MSTHIEQQYASVNGEGSMGVGANAKGKGEAQTSRKSEKRTPKKLGGGKSQAPAEIKQEEQTNGEFEEQPAEAGAEADAEVDSQDEKAKETKQEAELEPEPQQEPQSRRQSRRRHSRGRGRKGQDSDTESVARSEVSATGGRRQRQRAKKQQAKSSQSGPLDGISENVPGGELVNGAGDAVQDTAGQAVDQVGNTAGKAVSGLTGGGKKGKDDKDGGEQLRLRLELNLDIEIQLKAKIHGDLTLGLLN